MAFTSTNKATVSFSLLIYTKYILHVKHTIYIYTNMHTYTHYFCIRLKYSTAL